jgi:DNA-binding transcriptional regulator YhcF (GntR family)
MVKRPGGALLPNIAIDHAASLPIATQLYVALRDLILAGTVAHGTRLPATRTLARDIGVSRTTVIEAFDRLNLDGIVDSHVGCQRLPRSRTPERNTARTCLWSHAAAGARRRGRPVEPGGTPAPALRTPRIRHRPTGLRCISHGAVVAPRRAPLA